MTNTLTMNSRVLMMTWWTAWMNKNKCLDFANEPVSDPYCHIGTRISIIVVAISKGKILVAK